MENPSFEKKESTPPDAPCEKPVSSERRSVPTRRSGMFSESALFKWFPRECGPDVFDIISTLIHK